MKKLLLPTFLILSCTFSYCQTILVIVNADSKVYIDGQEEGKVHANDALKLSVTKGEHYVQAKGKWNGQEKEIHETIKVESDEQTMLKLSFGNESGNLLENKADSNAVSVADLNIKLPGTIAVNQWKSDNPGKKYNNYPTFYYAFEKGDDIVLEYKNPGSKTTNEIEVVNYPGKEVKYSNLSFTELEGIHIKVDERSIYAFRLTTNHAFSSSGELVIKRVPASTANKNFNTNVDKVKRYTPVYIQPTQAYTINSRTHLGGTKKETILLNLPSNTVEWFYKFSASRNNAQIEEAKSGLKLFEELSSMCGSQGKIISAGVDLLSSPPGTDYCNVYLLDEQNRVPFENNERSTYLEEGTRLNLMSGKVQVKSAIGQTFYLGITNPSAFYAINVVLEVVAITEKEELVMEQQN